MRILTYIGAVFILCVSVVGIAHAQFSVEQLATVQINLSPEHPQPGQFVQAQVSSVSEDIRASTIVWLVDDEIQSEGGGLTTFTFTAPKVGDSLALTALVQTPSGQVLSETIVVRPAEVTLLWEADTYTPPFYRGRARYSSGSTIRAEALAHFMSDTGTRINPESLVYTWSKNGTVLGDVSGVGASSLITSGPKFFGNYILSVEVATRDGLQVARSAARVETQEPQVRLYERDPLIGVTYHNGVTTDHVFSGSSQINVQAVPYFMDTVREDSSQLEYSWFIDGSQVLSVQGMPSALNVQLSSNENITTNIRIVIDHLRHLLQTGESEFAVTFEGTARNSLFGF